MEEPRTWPCRCFDQEPHLSVIFSSVICFPAQRDLVSMLWFLGEKYSVFLPLLNLSNSRTVNNTMSFCRFKHPWTGEYMHFSCPPPVDFSGVLSQLRSISKQKVPKFKTSYIIKCCSMLIPNVLVKIFLSGTLINSSYKPPTSTSTLNVARTMAGRN